MLRWFSIITFLVVGCPRTLFAQRTVSLSVAGSQITGAGAVRVNLTALGDENRIAFSVNFETSKLRFDNVALGTDASNGTVTIDSSSLAAGNLGVIVALPAGNAFTAGTRNVAILNFTVTALSTASTSILFTSTPFLGSGIILVNSNPGGGNFLGTGFTVIPGSVAPIFSSGSATAFSVGINGSFNATAPAVPAATFSVAGGTFPPWASLNATTGTISGTPPDASGSPFLFTLKASNTLGSSTQNFTLAVNTPPVITTQPTSQSVNAGATVSLTVLATGSPPLAYQWKKDGVTIVDATTATLTFSNVGQGTLGGGPSSPNSPTTVATLATAPTGSYSVTVSNIAGSVASQTVSITVVTPRIEFTQQPVNVTVAEGGNASFSVSATGPSSLTYQWLKDDAVIAGATATTYTLTDVRLTDAGTYRAVVRSSIGLSERSAGALLTVNSLPKITAQPAGASVVAGGAVALSVTATSSSSLGYQWTKNGVPLAGATSATLALSSVQASDAGVYAAVVSNVAGSVTSTGATLIVGPAITIQPAPTTVPAGGDATLTLTANGTPPLSYQWSKDGTALSGATNATLVLSNVLPTNAGNYTVVVTNSAGSVTSSAAALVVTIPNPGRLINLSILTTITPDAPSFTVGVVVNGAGSNATKAMLVRAVGPSLTPLGVVEAIADPKLDLFSGQTLVGANDNWGGSTTLINAFTSVGAFAFTSASSRDAAIYNPALPAGNYSVQVSGVGGVTGTVIAELYDATPPSAFTTTAARLINVSVLKQINAGENLTAGFVIGGATARQVLIRAIGPTLGSAPFEVPGVMLDPKLDLFNGQTLLRTNDDWGGGSALAAAFANVGAFALPLISKDAALLVTLQPGSYTAQVSGVSGTGGIALVEVYEVP